MPRLFGIARPANACCKKETQEKSCCKKETQEENCWKKETQEESCAQIFNPVHPCCFLSWPGATSFSASSMS